MERTVTVRTELESILVEQALVRARELEAVTDAAPDGAVRAVGELAAGRLGRRSLRADGWPGLLDHLGATPVEGRTESGQAGLDELVRYFAKPTDRLGY